MYFYGRNDRLPICTKVLFSLLSPVAVPLPSWERLGEVCFENAGEAGNARKAKKATDSPLRFLS
jgi:hypothetical protein